MIFPNLQFGKLLSRLLSDKKEDMDRGSARKRPEKKNRTESMCPRTNLLELRSQAKKRTKGRLYSKLQSGLHSVQ